LRAGLDMLGKRAALVLDFSLKGRSLKDIDTCSVGRLGAYSMDAYRLNGAEHPSRPLEDTVRMKDLNTAHFQKNTAHQPLKPGGPIHEEPGPIVRAKMFSMRRLHFLLSLLRLLP